MVMVTKDIPIFNPRILERYSFPCEGVLVTSRTIQVSRPRLEKQLAANTTVVRKEKIPKRAGPNWRETTKVNRKRNTTLEALPAKIYRVFLITVGWTN
jgi:hypothetical protein